MGNENSAEAKVAQTHTPTDREKELAINFLKNADDFLNEVARTTKETQEQIRELATSLKDRRTLRGELDENLHGCDQHCQTKEELIGCYRRYLREYDLLPPVENQQ